MLPNELFSSRETLEEAVQAAQELIQALPLEHRLAASTAVWLVANTALAKALPLDLKNVIPCWDGTGPISDLPDGPGVLQELRSMVAPLTLVSKEMYKSQGSRAQVQAETAGRTAMLLGKLFYLDTEAHKADIEAFHNHILDKMFDDSERLLRALRSISKES